VFTSNPILAIKEPDRYQLGQGVIPVAKGPDLGKSAPRESAVRSSATPTLVGPGSYEVGVYDVAKPSNKASRGVMDSKDQRIKSFQVSPLASQGPGPGAYNVTRTKGSLLLTVLFYTQYLFTFFTQKQMYYCVFHS
jgi:hypothetical protein